MLEPEEKINSLGKAAVRDTFKIPSVGTIAGCYVEQGEVHRNAKVRLIRDGVILRDNCRLNHSNTSRTMPRKLEQEWNAA
jgi:translation initiation factor IF-2